eukprot:gene7538-biopygen19568
MTTHNPSDSHSKQPPSKMDPTMPPPPNEMAWSPRRAAAAQQSRAVLRSRPRQRSRGRIWPTHGQACDVLPERVGDDATASFGGPVGIVTQPPGCPPQHFQ